MKIKDFWLDNKIESIYLWKTLTAQRTFQREKSSIVFDIEIKDDDKRGLDCQRNQKLDSQAATLLKHHILEFYACIFEYLVSVIDFMIVNYRTIVYTTIENVISSVSDNHEEQYLRTLLYLQDPKCSNSSAF